MKMRISGKTSSEKLTFCISHLEKFTDKPGDTLTDWIDEISIQDARNLLVLWRNLFRNLLRVNGYQDYESRRLTQKFFDAGRRSPPWQPGSETGNRRPQDGADGNRRSRWLFDPDHKFYAPEKTATLCEVRYYLQTLSMEDAPQIQGRALENKFSILLGHPLKPGKFLDPIQKIPVSFTRFIHDPRYVESGHLVPLGRGGKHTPDNATLMLRDSNRLQADLTIDELLETMTGILVRHGYLVSRSSK